MALIFLITLPGVASEEDPRITPVVKAVSKTLPSVVNIGTERIVSATYSPWGQLDPFEGLFRDFFAEQGEVKTTSLGSGSIVDPSGLIVTNAHVVHRATEINVILADGKQYLAKEIASDDINDIALLRISGLPENMSLSSINFAEPDDLLLGEPVIAMGNPYGLGHSISQGVLSAVGRKAMYEGEIIFSDILQTDAAVNPGNSGGPLININGEMIGINTAIYKEAQGIGFAIPVERVENILARWLIPERFRDVSLGIIPASRRKNGRIEIYIAEVIQGSPASKAGLRKEDSIKKINNQAVDALISVSRRIWKMKSGDVLRLEMGSGKIFTLKIEKLQVMDGRELAKRRLGIGLQKLTAELAEALDYPFEEGLIVSDILSDNQNIHRGDIIVRLGDVPIHDFSDIPRALQDKHYGDIIDALFIAVIHRRNHYYILKRGAELEVK